MSVPNLHKMSMTVLYPTVEDVINKRSLEVDIVAVHGVGGHPLGTWSWTPNTNNSETDPKAASRVVTTKVKESEKTLWLKDFLPFDLPTTRVMTFGYDGESLFDKSTSITHHAKTLLSSLMGMRSRDFEQQRPIIFLAHSLGGLVVKQALVYAHNDGRFRTVEESTIGVMFFGTPHRGSEQTNYTDLLGKMASITIKPITSLMKVLQRNSDILARLSLESRHQLSRYKMVSFYETQATALGLFSSLIVDKHSAVLDAPWESQIAVDANHSNMCKFSSREDHTYQKCLERITELLEDRADAKRKASSGKGQNQHYMISHKVTPNYTGREDIGMMLEEKCLPSQITNEFNKCWVLYGLGGSGKTQVCLKFAQDHRDLFWGIFWIDAFTEASIQQSFFDIARELGLEEDVLSVKRHLSETTESWLLIVDGADDPSIGLSKFFPTGGKGSILITSRNPEIKFHATVGSSDLSLLGQEDAINLLLRAAGDAVNSDAAAHKSAKSVIELLGGLPLAIHHAGAYIKHTHCTMEEYVEAYNNRRELLQRDYNNKGTSSHDPAESFETVFELPFQSIEGMGTEASRDALDLLCFFSFVSCDINVEELLERAWNNETKHARPSKNGNYQLRVLCNPTNTKWQPSRLRKALKILASFSLVKIARDGNTVSSHLLVQRAMHDRLSRDELSRYSNVTASTLASAAGTNLETEEFGFRAALLAHLSFFLRLHNDDFASDIDPLNWAESLSSFATAYLDSGQYGRALDLETRASKVSERVLGREHPDTLRSMSRIGRCLHYLQRPSEAAAVNKSVLQSRRAILGDDDFETLESIECLARSYYMLNQHQEATSLMEKALELRVRLLGAKHPRTITNMSHLAAYYRGFGRFLEAVELEEKVLRLRLRVLGEEHPETLDSMNNLAVTYGELGREQEAAELHENVLALSKRILGDRHRDSVTSMHNLAAIYSKLGQHAKAVHLEVRVLNLRREQLGKSHPSTLQAMANLATAYDAISRHGECLELRRELMQRLVGRDHPATLSIMADLATSNENTGQYQYAIELREKLLPLTEAQFGRGHQATLKAMADLATSYEITGSQQKAVELREFLQQTKKSVWGDEQAEPSTATRNVPVSSPTASDTESYSSDDDSTYSEESTFSQASSNTSSGSVRANAIERLAVTFENDLELLFAYEDLMLVMSRRKFIHGHMRLLKTYFADLQPTTAEQRQAVSFLGRRRQRRLVAKEICNRTSTNRTLVQAAKETSDGLSRFNRLQLPDNSGGQTTISLTEEVERDGFAHRDQYSDESEDSDKEFSREPDEISTSEVDGLMALLIKGVSYSQYKHGLQDFARRQYSPEILHSVMRTGNVDAVRGVIERHFDAVAAKEFEWLWELKSLGHSYHDIAELLLDDMNESPWIFLNQPEPQEALIRSDFHASSCVHQGGKKGPRLVMADIENTEDLKKLIAEHCGLAGVVPRSRDPKAWTGLVNFSGERQSTASITYDMPGSRHGLVSRVRQALQRFCGTATYLQRKGLCCTSFTVLRYTSMNGCTAIELRPISFRLASDLFVVLQLLDNNWDSPGLISRCLPRLNEIANEVICTICDTNISGNKDDLDFQSCLNNVSLAVQILTLGLYLYSQAHTGSVHPFFLMNPLSQIHLFGTQSPLHQSTKARIRISLARFTCMAEVTGDLVTVFGSHQSSEAQSVEQAYDLLASPEDLAETWDAWRLIMDTTTPYGENIYAIEVGEGFISSVGESHECGELGKALPKLHWSRGAQAMEFKTPFSLRLKALIGTTTVNTQCPVDEHQSWLSANVGMNTLGAEESYWQRSEAQAGLQTGLYVVAQFNVTWIKRPGTTLKHIHLRPDINLPFLQSDWGLQISYCTSVARRVSLCEVLADVTPILVEALLQKPPGWQSLQADHNIVSALRGGGFKDWFERLNAGLQSDVLRIVRYVLLVLQDTGIDRSGDHLIAVWPRKSNPLGCFKIPCKDATFWARMLKDSPDCATFAYVTPLCLETNDWKCQRLETAPWHNRSVVLNTAVSLHLKNGIATAGPWRLRHEQTYLIGQPEKYLLGKVSLPMTPATIHIPPHLYISSSMIPASLQSRIKERLREKQCTDAPAHGVVVLAKQPYSLLLDAFMRTR